MKGSFPRFVIVGGIGFVVDIGVLQLLLMAGWNAVGARAVSIPLAVFATWLLNRSFTFPDAQQGPALPSFLRYAGVSATGATVNFTVYAALVFMGLAPLLALAVASIVALTVNYLGSKHFAFRVKRT